jgi:dTDP-4-dehydrorhamnose reductase
MPARQPLWRLPGSLAQGKSLNGHPALWQAYGQLGSELRRSLLPLGKIHALDKEDLDLTNPDSVAAVIHALRPTVIVNASAYTAVDRAESEPELAFNINARAPEVMAHAAHEIGAALIHYSTDYVFDGAKNAPIPKMTSPTRSTIYGQSKLDGEQRILQTGAAALIFAPAGSIR